MSTAHHLQHEVLETLTAARRYNAWLADLVRPYLGDDPVEIGAGIGTYSALWLEHGVPRLTVTDIHRSALAALGERFDRDPRVTVMPLDLTAPPAGTHSALVALNVLEHIADDVSGLRGAVRLVRPGGLVTVVVPAFGFAMSRFDQEIGHHRRYTVASLRAAFRQAGLVPVEVRYLNAAGLVAWVAGMKWLRLAPHEGPAVRIWDALMVPPTRAIERRVRPPFGQSVFGLARVPAE